MTNKVFIVVRTNFSCAWLRGKQNRYQKLMTLFPATGFLEFVALDILGPSRKAARGSIFVLGITGRFIKLTRCYSLRTPTAAVIANDFLDCRAYALGTSIYVNTDNGNQFTDKFFDAVCLMLGILHFFTTFYHPQKTNKRKGLTKQLFNASDNTLWIRKPIGICTCNLNPRTTICRYSGRRKQLLSI